jgi:hypothetical protein
MEIQKDKLIVSHPHFTPHTIKYEEIILVQKRLHMEVKGELDGTKCIEDKGSIKGVV